jgi:hypothetical protein
MAGDAHGQEQSKIEHDDGFAKKKMGLASSFGHTSKG